MIGSENPEKLAEFYEQVLEKAADSEEDGWWGFSVGGCYLSISSHDKVKGKAAYPERIILNFETTKVKEEFERVKKLGAKVVAEPYSLGEDESMWIATFADPDGNYFQLMTPWEGEK